MYRHPLGLHLLSGIGINTELISHYQSKVVLEIQEREQ